MKIVRFNYKRNIRWGIIKDDRVIPLKNEPFKKIVLCSERIPYKKCRLLPPTVPQKIILTGLNYKDHAHELKMKIPREPIIFLKPPTSLIGHKDLIIYPKEVKRLDYEAELAVVIKKKARNVSQKDAEKYIIGFTCLNDITARDIQAKDGQWTRAKSFDTFCSLGPWLETEIDSSNLKIQLYLNGRLKQSSSTAHFIFSVRYLVSFISRVMTLLPGDVISTGTPSGVGRMKKGDVVEVNIERIGVLKNTVA